MIPLFGQEQPEGKRNVLEGRLIWLALSALRIGVSVVLDFGVWAKVERSALRALAASVGATSELVYLEVDEEEQWRQARAMTDAGTTFEMTRADLERWRPIFQPPDATEVGTADSIPHRTASRRRSWSDHGRRSKAPDSRRVRSNVQQDVVGVGLELPGPGEACLASHPLQLAPSRFRPTELWA
jgi:predicted kinase